jgi:transcriptional regulator with XRE-family HTH domain
MSQTNTLTPLRVKTDKAQIAAQIGATLTRLREERELTKAEFSRRCGLEQPVTYRFEAGERLPLITNLIDLGQGLGGMKASEILAEAGL